MIVVINAVWIKIDEENDNIDGKWIPLGYVFAELVVDSSDRAELADSFNDNTIVIIENLGHSEFTHIVEDAFGNLFAVTVTNNSL